MLARFGRAFATKATAVATQADPFTVLELQPTASVAEVRQKYFQLAKIHHPDNNKGDSKQFDVIRKAYESAIAQFDVPQWGGKEAMTYQQAWAGQDIQRRVAEDYYFRRQLAVERYLQRQADVKEFLAEMEHQYLLVSEALTTYEPRMAADPGRCSGCL